MDFDLFISSFYQAKKRILKVVRSKTSDAIHFPKNLLQQYRFSLSTSKSQIGNCLGYISKEERGARFESLSLPVKVFCISAS